MRSRSFDWPACLMSSTQQGMRARAKAHGFIAFLAKPVETNELIAVLDCSAELLSNEGA
jgi:CheY-like chemotaxis protein